MSEQTADLTDRLKAEALSLGFTMVGVVQARPARRLAAYLRWIDEEMHGEMGYLARPDRIVRRQDPGVVLPGVRSIVCVGLEYSTPLPPEALLADPGRGRFSNYAFGVDYHDVMTPRLEALGDWLAREAGEAVQWRAYVDTGAILERDHAETAGLGFTGKNTMLIAPRRGSWFFLGELLTTAALTPDPFRPQAMPGCGSCRRCLDACPTAAFPEPYVLDARRCISYLTIELKGWIPAQLRPLMGNWVYGCDVCQTVCPFNRFAPEDGAAVFRAASLERVAPPLPALLALDDVGFATRFAGSPVARIGRARLVRNACVAAGNWGSQRAAEPLVSLLADDSALVRGHAAWALGRIGGEAARDALAAAMSREPDEAVGRELRDALR